MPDPTREDVARPADTSRGVDGVNRRRFSSCVLGVAARCHVEGSRSGAECRPSLLGPFATTYFNQCDSAINIGTPILVWSGFSRCSGAPQSCWSCDIPRRPAEFTACRRRSSTWSSSGPRGRSLYFCCRFHRSPIQPLGQTRNMQHHVAVSLVLDTGPVSNSWRAFKGGSRQVSVDVGRAAAVVRRPTSCSPVRIGLPPHIYIRPNMCSLGTSAVVAKLDRLRSPSRSRRLEVTP